LTVLRFRFKHTPPHEVFFSREEDMLDMAVFLKENSRLGWYK